MSRTPLTLIAAGVSLALVAGCGSDAPKTPAGAAKPGTASLYGTYERDVTKADIERTDKFRSELGPKQDKPKPHHVVITIAQGDPASTLSEISSDGTAVTMDISATSGGNLDLQNYVDPGKGAYCGPEIAEPASYTWKLDGRSLVLSPRNDQCADRDSTLTGKWTRR